MSVARTEEYMIFLKSIASNVEDRLAAATGHVRNSKPCFRRRRVTSMQCMFSRTDLSSYTSDKGVFAFFYRSDRLGPSKQSTHHEGIAQSWVPNIVAHGSNQDGQNILRAKYLSCSPCPDPADWLLRLIGSLPWRPRYRLEQVRMWRHDTDIHQE